MSESQNQPDPEQLERIEEQRAARAAALARQQAEQAQRAHVNQDEIMVSVLGTNLISNIVYELHREKQQPENNPHLEWCEGYENGTVLPPRLDDVFNGSGSFGLNYGGQGHMAWLSRNFHGRALANTANAMYKFIMKTVCPNPRLQHAFMNQILFYVKLANAVVKAAPQVNTNDEVEDDETYINRVIGLIQRPSAPEKVEKPVSKVEPKEPKETKAPAKPVKTVAPQKPKAKVEVVEEEAEIEEADEEEESDEADDDELDEDDDDDDLDDLEEEDDGWATKKKPRPVAKQVARPAKSAVRTAKASAKTYSRK